MYRKNIPPGLIAAILTITAVFIFILFPRSLLPAQTKSDATADTAVEKAPDPTEPRIVVAMKTSMYDQVADDEDIDLMAQWIKDGGKNDQVFKDKILPIIKNDCRNCHSKTSTMTKAVPHIPFANYEDVRKFTQVSPTNTQCLECHANSVLKEQSDEKFQTLFVAQTKFQNSVHKKMLCTRCHVELHPETNKIYQDTTAFNTHILAGPTSADAERHKLFKPACTNCHPKVGDKLKTSIHAAQPQKPEIKFPRCVDCHGTQHNITDPKQNETKFDVVNNCGTCHKQLIKTYFSSYHGKAAKLGGERVAKCFNCHGSHDLLSPSQPKSTLHAENIQETCQACHSRANQKFTSFQPHADPFDRANYPYLFYSFWAMTLLIIGTFLVFGIHALLWLNRSLWEKFKDPKKNTVHKEPAKNDEMHVKRFNVLHTVLHLMLIVSFMTLAITGMALKYPDNPLFSSITHFMGGPDTMGLAHRMGAILTFTYFGVHLAQLAILYKKRKITLKGLFKEEYSLILLPRDFKEFKANLRYFLGKGPKPEFGRWTYWEKFDYMAEFWGVAIISSTGLALAYPEVATRFLPGWTLNIATIIHSFEALLATGFIFSMHFFHSHMRPEIFPMDTVIFTQRVPLCRFKEERVREYRQLVEAGELENHLIKPSSKWYTLTVYFFGWIFLSIGLISILAIIFSLLGKIF